MQILVRVNQSQCLRLGINAPNSTAYIEVDPAALTPEERDVIAANLEDGHDVSRRLESIAPPTLEGLRAVLAARIAERAERAAREIAERAEADKRILAALATSEQTARIGLGRDGTYVPPAGAAVSTDITYPGIAGGNTWYVGRGTPEVNARYDAAIAAQDAAIEAAASAALPALREQLAVFLAAEAAAAAAAKEREAAEEAEYDALYARLPEALRERDAAGYADEKEVERAIRRLAREDAGLGGFEGWSDSAALTTLSDKEFAALKAARERAPEGSTVEPHEVWNLGDYRVAEDGEVRDRIDVRCVARIEWQRGGIKVVASLPLE